MDKNITEEFQTSIKNGVVTGCLKFSNKFSSQIQIYSAVKEWEKEDKGLIYASIRTDGDDFIALDFRYDESVNSRKDKSILRSHSVACGAMMSHRTVILLYYGVQRCR